MQNVDVSLTLSKNIITRDYQRAQIIIDLSFITDDVADRLIYCEINNEVKNAFDYLSMRTVINLRAQKESQRHSRRNWKKMNMKKFDNVLKNHLSKSLLKAQIDRQRIDEYITKILNILKKTTEAFTL